MSDNKLQLGQFLLFGDSITEFAFNTQFQSLQDPALYNNGKINPIHQQFCLGAGLTNAYVRKLDIVQKGFSGYNSRWALKILPKLLEIYKNIKIAYIFFGSNDACMGERQHVPLAEYEENTLKLIDMYKQHGIEKIILITPALINEKMWISVNADEVKQGYTRSNEDFEKYGAALEKIGLELNLPVVNLNKSFKEYANENLDGKWQELLCDGLHFSGHGYYVFYTQLLQTIKQNYSDLSPSEVPYNLPNWRLVQSDASNLDL
ncbi:hypothetical protein QEN19_002365 [Hanseniaspora menglaensis]